MQVAQQQQQKSFDTNRQILIIVHYPKRIDNRLIFKAHLLHIIKRFLIVIERVPIGLEITVSSLNSCLKQQNLLPFELPKILHQFRYIFVYFVPIIECFDSGCL